MVIVISDGSLNFSGISGDNFFIIFHCVYLILLSFLHISLASGLSILLIFSKKPASGFIDVLKGFLFLYFLQFCPDISYFLFLLAFEFIFSCFSSYFNCDVRVSILDFSWFFLWAVSAINFPLTTALAVPQRFWYTVSLFSLVSKNLFISALISLFIH